MADDQTLNLDGIPEAQREAVTSLVNSAVEAAIGVVVQKSESDLAALRSTTDKRYSTLEDESRGYQRTIAEMKDEVNSAGASELGKSVADLEAGWKAQSDARALQDEKDRADGLQKRLDAQEFETGKIAALAAGVPEGIVNQATSKSELDMATTIHATYGGKAPDGGSGDGRPKGTQSPVSTMTPSGDSKPAIDTSTHDGQILHSMNELAAAGMPMDQNN
jgi:hypothetical protein